MGHGASEIKFYESPDAFDIREMTRQPKPGSHRSS